MGGFKGLEGKGIALTFSTQHTHQYRLFPLDVTQYQVSHLWGQINHFFNTQLCVMRKYDVWLAGVFLHDWSANDLTVYKGQDILHSSKPLPKLTTLLIALQIVVTKASPRSTYDFLAPATNNRQRTDKICSGHNS